MEQRKGSCFLTYEDADGLFADFHANRHTFISNLSGSGVPLSVAQKLARHSDPRLTANRYTHVELNEQAQAIDQLPDVPGSEFLVTGMVTGESGILGHLVSSNGTEDAQKNLKQETTKPLGFQGFSDNCKSKLKVHPEGFEPPTLGSEDRCSIQLSYGCVFVRDWLEVI